MSSPAPSKQRPPNLKGKSIDLATIIRILIAFCGILGGLIMEQEKGDVTDVAQATAALVLGGTCGAVLATTPLPIALRAFKALRRVLIARERCP
jgi:flagellar motor component MotA